LAFVHATPHPPQLAALVSVLVSQPLFGLPSQFAYPAVHTGVHTPLAHAVVPFAFVHACPHAPQFAVVESTASQPFATLLSQLPKPMLQAMLQLPATHDAVPLVLLQTAPQVPQFDTFVDVLVSQPLLGLPSQLPQPALQAESAQVPVEQLSVAFARSHTVLHAPQLASVFRGVSHPFELCPSQSPNPVAHDAHPHVPLLHVGSPLGHVHTLLHVPQCVALVSRLVSQPFTASPSQLPQPEVHVGAQTPEVQTTVPCPLVHVVPHAPQFAMLVCSAVSQPFTGLLSQLPNPLAHTGEQIPATQEVVPFGFEHEVPHAPQFTALVNRFASQPFAALPSQLP
jgi:hypothetical protein